jgi:hypothetical protein
MSTDSEIKELKKALANSRQQNQNLQDLMDKKDEKSKHDKNQNFIQLYKNQAKELRRLGNKNALSLNLFLLFGEKMNKQNAIMVSSTALEQITGYSKRSISSALKVLKEQLFIKVVKVGSANAYLINSDIFWSTSAKLKDKISIFSATVIATGTEQDPEYLENWKKIKLKQMPMIGHHETPITDGIQEKYLSDNDVDKATGECNAPDLF